ncbi:MAG TPA: MBL fold metallo-hydrolase [Ktedonobacterales bacterium]|nr:MBL fold metallo-hydrolase [Ktedonobacterales bacterium]
MATLTLTRVAHSTTLIDIDGHVILTDPWFSEKWGYYHGEPYGVTLDQLPKLAGVIVSHGHYDHYDMDAFAAYPDKTVPMLVKRGIARAARAAGFTNVTEMDAWEQANIGPLTFTAAPGKHAVPEITYVIAGLGRTVYFGGDTLLIPELAEIARRFPHIDLAILAVNGLMLRPLLNRQVVMNAEEAAELCAILKPTYAVPTHYAFTGGPIQDRVLLKYSGTAEAFASAVARRAPQTHACILAPGEPLRVSERVTQPQP